VDMLLVAEGAGQHLMPQTGERDASGNLKFSDIGIFLKERITEYFKKEGIPMSLKYIDPSYIIRSAPANPNDSIYCSRLGAHAAHAAMAGKTQALVSLVNNKYVHLPIKVAVAERNRINLEGSLWRDVLENTRQPASMRN
jgi:6-phosphofructokinase 1